MGVRVLFISLLLACAIYASAQTYTFECVASGRLSGDSCDICPNTIVESRSFNGLVIYRDSSFYRWIDQPYSIRVKPGEVIEYWEHAVSPYSERITIPLELTGFYTVQGMADSTWCNSPGPQRYQELHFDSVRADLARARVTGSNTGFGIRAGHGVLFGFDSDTLEIEVDTAAIGGGSVSSGNATTVAGGIVDWGGATTENTVVTGNGSHTVSWLNLGGIDFNAKGWLFLQNHRRLMHEKGAHSAMGSDTLFNFFAGYLAGQNFADASTGYANTAIGTKAGLALDGNAPGATSNTLIGAGAGEAITTGSFNTVVGTRAASTGPTTVEGVTAVGHHALLNTTGAGNTAVGRSAAEATTSGLVTAIGSFALYSNTTGSKNLGIGTGALRFNVTGSENTAIGHESGYNPLGDENTFIGMQAGLGASGSTAALNTGIGRKSMVAITTGVSNSAVGRSTFEACTSCDDNAAVGLNAALALTTGDRNTYLGRGAGASFPTTGSDNIIVGYNTSPASDVSNVAMFGANIYITAQNNITTGAVGIGNTSPQRKLHVTGEARVTDLTTDTPTGVVGHDADGDLGSVGFSGMSMVAGVLTATDGSASNEAWTIDADDADTEVISNQTVKFQGSGGISTNYVPGTDILEINGTAATVTAANNGLSLSGTTVQWGGALIQNTTIDGATFYQLHKDGKKSFMRYEGNPFTDVNVTGGVDITGKAAAPSINTAPLEDNVLTLRGHNGTSTYYANALFFGSYTTEAYGSWVQARNEGAYTTHYPINMNPNGGKIGVGRDPQSDQLNAHFTISRSLSGSTIDGILLHIENTEGNKAAMSFGKGFDVIDGEVGYFDSDDIVRLTNRNTASSSQIRLAIGGETSDRAVLMPTTAASNARFGAGFTNTTGLNSTLHSKGSIAGATLVTSGAPTFDETKFYVAYTGAGNQTYTLPAAADCEDRIFWIENYSAAGIITLSANVKKANGASFNTIDPGQHAWFISDGADFRGYKITSE